MTPPEPPTCTHPLPRSAPPIVHTTLPQALHGSPLGTQPTGVICLACNDRIPTGATVTIYAHRPADAPSWDPANCYCADCAPTTLTAPTRGVAEALVAGTLATLDGPTQPPQHCLVDITTVVVSSATNQPSR